MRCARARRGRPGGGLGVSVVSRRGVRARDTRVVALRLQGERCMRDLLVVQRAGAPLSPAAAKLPEHLKASNSKARQANFTTAPYRLSFRNRRRHHAAFGV